MSFKWAGQVFERFPSGLFAPIQHMGLGQQMYAQHSFQQALGHQMQQQVAAQIQGIQHQHMAQLKQAALNQANMRTGLFQQQYNQAIMPGLANMFAGLAGVEFLCAPKASDFDDPEDFDIAMYEFRGALNQKG